MNLKRTKNDFLKVLKDHERILFKVSEAYCKDPEDRKDIIQEIIIQLWNSFDNYNPEYKYSTWIYRISLNVAISHYRKESKRKGSLMNINDELITITENHMDAQLLDDNLELLHRFISKLDKLNKALILLSLESFSYLEIAEMLGISETNVATKISRKKKGLKAQFENHNDVKKLNYGNTRIKRTVE